MIFRQKSLRIASSIFGTTSSAGWTWLTHRLKALESGNDRLKHLIAEAMQGIDGLKAFSREK
ncbi:hypothetical protein [Burkholderia pyrrocinia]|uniref:hypothetical protein n=1 Tax=Burkholderia pyrrocinia TaxID=60550 RepID=UPI002AB003C8|nr:hypothetical protein [Burkholderia pyrrocinia]